MDTLMTEKDGLQGADFSKSVSLGKADQLLGAMEKSTAKGEKAIDDMKALLAQAAPNATGIVNASKAYYPIMYFVDKKFTDVPTTCSGVTTKKPLLGSMDSCARACDADVHNCIGFSYFPKAGDLTEDGLCFL